MLRPVWKWTAARRPEGSNQGANHVSPPINHLDDSLQAVMVVFIPLWRNAFRTAPHINRGSFFRLGESWFKRFPAIYILVDAIARVNSTQSGIGKVPVPSIERITLVEKR